MKMTLDFFTLSRSWRTWTCPTQRSWTSRCLLTKSVDSTTCLRTCKSWWTKCSKTDQGFLSVATLVLGNRAQPKKLSYPTNKVLYSLWIFLLLCITCPVWRLLALYIFWEIVFYKNKNLNWFWFWFWFELDLLNIDGSCAVVV